jgi:predicted transcriptional regulator
MGAAIGLTYSPRSKSGIATRQHLGYEESVSKMGFVEINKTEGGTTYKLTDLGRRFLRDYRFLDRAEAGAILAEGPQ